MNDGLSMWVLLVLIMQPWMDVNEKVANIKSRLYNVRPKTVNNCFENMHSSSKTLTASFFTVCISDDH